MADKNKDIIVSKIAEGIGKNKDGYLVTMELRQDGQFGEKSSLSNPNLINYDYNGKTRHSFWIMRLQDEEKEMHIKNISYAINECVKEEYREEFYKAIIRIFKKAEHNEKYDADSGQSVIISSSQISSLLLYLFHLLWLTADCKRDSEETIRVQAELIDGYKKLADEQEKYIDE